MKIIPVLAATSFGFSLVQLDVTIVNIALPSISATFGGGISWLQWIVDAYALTFAALLLTGGFLSDRFGARTVYLVGIIVFATASLACGVASDVVTLIIARTVQGIGAAAMLPSSLALLNAATAHDKRLRAWAIGCWTAISSISIASGPILGAVIISIANWRYVFLINLPLCLLAVGLTLRLNVKTHKNSRRSFDLAGQLLAFIALLALVSAVIEARALGLMHPFVLTGMAIGPLAIICFIVVERRAKEPLIPMEIFHLSLFRISLFYGIVVNLTYYGVVFIISLYLQKTLGYTPMQAAYAYLPLTATFFVVNLVAGTLVGRYGARLPMIGGALVDALGFALLAGLSSTSSFYALILPFMLIPAGMGTGVPAMTTVVLENVPREFSGVAIASINAARQAAGSVGVAIFGVLAGDSPDEVLRGLHSAAMIAIVLLILASAASMLLPRRSAM
ncbi:MFS transporter [Agrobacterium vitis]|uniref:MFS transporter n=1 Tax=Agrobacterium vitis TaxID=373 RepID=UPI003D29222B